jgi:polyferredoxin
MVAMASKKPESFASRWASRRGWVQAAFLLLWLDPLLARMHMVCAPVFHCYSCPLATFACPIGVLAHFSALHVMPFVAVGMLVLVGGLVGTAVCGWACPFGFLQDLVARIPTPKFQLPAWTGNLRYVVLATFVLAVPFLYGAEHPMFFCRLCPAGALEGAIPNMAKAAMAGQEIAWPSAVKMTILVLVLAAMLFKWRPWCTVLCPLGAIFGLFNRFSLVVLRFYSDDCTGCGTCSQICKYGVLPDESINNSRCIRCLECTRCDAVDLSSAVHYSGLAGEGPASRNRSARK